MNNLEKATAIESRDRALRTRITQALLRAAQQPLKYAHQIPLLQASAITEVGLAARIAMLSFKAITALEDEDLAGELAEVDQDLSNFEHSIEALLHQSESQYAEDQ